MDDGAACMDDSLAMLEAAVAGGTTDIVATPHADTQYRYDAARVEEAIAELNRRMDGRIQIHAGCDFHITHDNVLDALAHPRRYTVAHRSYLMVELSNQVIFPNTGEMFEKLEREGMRMVITHPERNPLLRRRPELIEQWVAEGRYMQLTAQSLTGGWGESAARFCRLLMEKGWAHFVASDTHDPVHRPPSLRPAYEWLTREYGPEWAEALLVVNPGHALRGEPLVRSATTGIPARRNWIKRLFGG